MASIMYTPPPTDPYRLGNLGSSNYLNQDLVTGLSSYLPPTAPVANPSIAAAYADPSRALDVMPVANAAAAATGTPGIFGGLGDWFKSSGFLGSTDMKTGIKTDGWGGLALGAGQGIMNGFLGMQQYGLAKDAFEQSKRQFNLNYEAQRKTTNAALEDRQRARVASNSGAYQSVGDYMSKNGI